MLLVEDDPVSAAVVSLALDDLRLVNPLHAALDIPDAIEWLRAASDKGTPPALILLDMHLPGGTGLDLLRWLRQRGRHRDVPVIMLTSSSELWEVNQAHDLGISSYLVKPVGLSALGDIVRSLPLPWGLLPDGR